MPRPDPNKRSAALRLGARVMRRIGAWVVGACLLSAGVSQAAGPAEPTLRLPDDGASDPAGEGAAIDEVEAELSAEGVAVPKADDDSASTRGEAVDARPKNPPRSLHEIIPGDTFDSIAARYGVSVKTLKRWNKRELANRKGMLVVGRSLRIYVHDPPPPRVELEYEIQRGDSWSKIASDHGVDRKLLERWNRGKSKKLPKLRAGQKVRIWVEQTSAATGETKASARVKAEADELARALAKIKVRGNGVSVGFPNRGYLQNGVAVPKRADLFTCRKPEYCYGSTHAIRQLLTAATVFKHRTKYEKPLVIGAISKRKGGRFRPHRSHQSGRDIDIRLPVRSSVKGTEAKSLSDIDWDAAWKLVDAFIETGQIQYIFLTWSQQRRLYKAARTAGASKEQLERWIQWPRKPNTNNGIVRHSEGHDRHIHVRVACGPRDRRCGGR
ncbi:MAG: penicillin-insensitive murein endopeptidase [Nannocystaceae bacterium]